MSPFLLISNFLCMNALLQKILSGQNVSAEEKMQLARTLVAEKVANILEQKVAIAMLSGNQKIRIELTARECTDSDENIALFLKVL